MSNNYVGEPIEYATYDAEDNKLRVYSDRVGDELFAKFKELKFQRAYQQGCFFATWTPQREDMVLALVDEIDDEDSTLADRAADRAERFSDYSANATTRMQAASKAAHDATRFIPFGQPLMVGHHSEAKHRAALKRSQRQATKSVEEREKSTYWADRAKSVTRHATRKFAPGPTLRRIKKLKAQRRKEERTKKNGISAWAIEKWLDEHAPRETGDWTPMSQRLNKLDDEQSTNLQTHLDNYQTRIDHNCDRWIAHLDGQIEFWQVIYDASPAAKVAKKFIDLKVGGWIFNGRGWAQIKRVNRSGGEISSVSIDRDTCTANWMPRIIKYPEIKDYSKEGPQA